MPYASLSVTIFAHGPRGPGPRTSQGPCVAPVPAVTCISVPLPSHFATPPGSHPAQGDPCQRSPPEQSAERTLSGLERSNLAYHGSPNLFNCGEVSLRGVTNTIGGITPSQADLLQGAPPTSNRHSSNHRNPSNGRAQPDSRHLPDCRNVPTTTIPPIDSEKNMPTEVTVLGGTSPLHPHPHQNAMAHPIHPRQPRLNAGTAQILRNACDLTNVITYASEYAFAHGGYSDVYLGTLQRKYTGMKGEEIEENISIVIKVIRAYTRERLDFERARKRLNREVNVLRRLRHPNIAEFLGIAFKQELRPCIVIKCYKNGITPKYIEMNPKVNRLALVVDIARGLEYLHTLPTPIVHGDLKGCNTLVTDDGHAVITDFGLARIIEEYSAPTGFTTTTLGGSIRWSAPELLFDPDADIDDDSDDEEEDPTPRNPSLKSDIWGFGCVAYELFTGLNPYPDAKYDWNIVKSFTSRNVPSTKRISDGRDRWLKESTEVYRLLRRCWMFTPASRPTIRAITQQLKNAVMAREEGLDI